MVSPQKPVLLVTRSTARITPRTKQLLGLRGDASYAVFVRFFQRISSPTMLIVLLPSFTWGGRCFVLVFTKRSRTFDASRTTLQTREWYGFYKTNRACMSRFSHSRLSSASRNCLGVHGPSDARQFHMNTCCLTAGFRALSPSTFSLADSLGGKNVFNLCQLLSST